MPADLRLLEAEQLRADESLLTGESEPVGKSAEADVDEDAPLGDRSTLLHAGTAVLPVAASLLVVDEVAKWIRTRSKRTRSE